MKNSIKTLAMATAIVTFAGGAFADNYGATGTMGGETRQGYDAPAYNETTRTGDAATRAGGSIQLQTSEVRQLQEALRDEGYNLTVDGIMGPNTQSALRSYQAENNLNATGNVDNDTLSQLNIRTTGTGHTAR